MDAVGPHVQPVVHDKKVISVGQDIDTGDFRCFAVDAVNGDDVWSTEVPGYTSAPLMFHDGNVYVGCTENSLLVLDTEDGSEAWSLESSVDGWNAEEGVIYLVTSNDVKALDASDGSELWSQDSTYAYGQPAVGDTRLFLRTGSGLVALDKASGSILWKVEEVQGSTNRSSTPVFHRGRVYQGGSDVAAYDAVDGDRLWRNDRYELVNEPAVTTDGVFVSTWNRQILKLDIESGEEEWSHEADSTLETGGIRRGPVVTEEAVFYVMPHPRGTTIYRGITDFLFPVNTVNALDVDDGSRMWGYPLQRDIWSEPIVLDDVIYVSTRTNEIHALPERQR